MHALKANSFDLARSVGLSHGGLVGGNYVPGIPRNSWAVYPSFLKWLIGIGMRMRVQFPRSVIAAIVLVSLVDNLLRLGISPYGRDV